MKTGIKYFSEMCFPKLQKLNLAKNSIKSEGMQYFAKMSELTQLRELNLIRNVIGNEGILFLI